MVGKSPVTANEEQKAALRTLAGSRDRGEADRARALLLTLSGWTIQVARRMLFTRRSEGEFGVVDFCLISFPSG